MTGAYAGVSSLALEGEDTPVDRPCIDNYPAFAASSLQGQAMPHRGAPRVPIANSRRRVLWNDPATGVMRHADAGYAAALACAREQGLDLPLGG